MSVGPRRASGSVCESRHFRWKGERGAGGERCGAVGMKRAVAARAARVKAGARRGGERRASEAPRRTRR